VPMAAAGPPKPAPFDIDFKKKPGGPWIEYTSGQKRVGQEPKAVFWRVRNQDTGDQDVSVEERRSGDGQDDYRIRWFRGDKDVTNDLRGPGYEFTFASDESRKFKATIKAKKANPGPLCLTPAFTALAQPDVTYSYSLYVNDSSVCG